MNPLDNVKLIVFSKNRSMQLDLTLNSFYAHCLDTDLPEINVIFTADENHVKSYQILKEEHPFVNFIWEGIFSYDLKNAINKNYILFVVDDTIFTRDFSINEIIETLDKNKCALGFSLRLGENCHICYPYNQTQKIPAFTNVDNNIVAFDWRNSQLDWNYPLEISSSLFRKDDIFPYLEHIQIKNPNELETILNYYKNKFFYSQPLHLCYLKSVAFAAPMNRIQNVALANRYKDDENYSSESLLEKYLDGWRVDYHKFDDYTPNGCHEEVEFEYVSNPVDYWENQLEEAKFQENAKR